MPGAYSSGFFFFFFFFVGFFTACPCTYSGVAHEQPRSGTAEAMAQRTAAFCFSDFAQRKPVLYEPCIAQQRRKESTQAAHTARSPVNSADAIGRIGRRVEPTESAEFSIRVDTRSAWFVRPSCVRGLSRAAWVPRARILTANGRDGPTV